jgi:hypothetical protein
MPHVRKVKRVCHITFYEYMCTYSRQKSNTVKLFPILYKNFNASIAGVLPSLSLEPGLTAPLASRSLTNVSRHILLYDSGILPE